MKANIYPTDLIGLIPENDDEKELLERFYHKGVFAQSLGEHWFELGTKILMLREEQPKEW